MYTTSPPGQSSSALLESHGSDQEVASEQGWSFDDFADTFAGATNDEAKGGARGQGPEKPTEPLLPAPQSPSLTNIRLLLLELFKRTLKYGLLPQVTAAPTAADPNHGTPCWKVTIALKELGIFVSAHGSRRLLAEVAASIQFELVLSSPETIAKLEKFPLADINPENAIDILHAYCRMLSMSTDDLRRDVMKVSSEAYEARIFLEERQLGKPAVSAVKDLAKGISPLALAHGVLNGDPDVWPAGVENPFEAKIVVGDAGMRMLRNLIRAARAYLTTTPGPAEDASSHESHHKIDRDDAKESESETASSGAAVHQAPDLDQFLAGLPFSPSIANLLILGASIRCLEPAIILAALGRKNIYRKLAPGEKYQADHLDPYVKNTVHGDHSDLVLLYQRIRKERQKKPKTEGGLKAVGYSANFDPSGIRSVNAAARDIERILRSAGLCGYPDGDSNIQLPGSDLQVRKQPYGSHLNLNSTMMLAVRHLMALGFGHNIAQYGYGTLLPGGLPELRVGSRKVHIGSPLRAPMNVRQLKKHLENGPLFVLSGTAEHPNKRDLTAQYSSPISTWQAVLFGEDLSLAQKTWAPQHPGAAQLVLNGWLPVFVLSEVPEFSDRKVANLILDARHVLHRAIRKAMQDYIKHSWTSVDFYKLLKEIPIEMNTEAMKQKSVKGGSQSSVSQNEEIVEGEKKDIHEAKTRHDETP